MTPKDSAAKDEPCTDREAPQGESRSRRPYRTPELRHLGSVRELTLGSTMGKGDGMGGLQA